MFCQLSSYNNNLPLMDIRQKFLLGMLVNVNGTICIQLNSIQNNVQNSKVSTFDKMH